MSLKSNKDIDIERHPELWSKKLVATVEDLKNGKRSAKRRLRKFVSREITYEYYEELIERHKGAKKGKKDHECYSFDHLTETGLSILMFVLFIASIYILGNSIIIKNSIWLVISFALLCLFLVILYTVKIDYKRNLYNKISWVAEKQPTGKFHSSNCSLRDLNLVEYIKLEQGNQNLPEQFRIDFLNETEKETLSRILNEHKEYIIQQYFYSNLTSTTRIYKLKNLEYYIFSLHNFLCNKFVKEDVYENSREDVSGHCYKQKLTKQGRVYYKLLLITELYIETNKDIQKLYNYFRKDSNYTMEIIEKNECVFYK